MPIKTLDFFYLNQKPTNLGKNMIIVISGNSWQTTEMSAAQTADDFKIGIHGTSRSIRFLPTSSQLFESVIKRSSSSEMHDCKKIASLTFSSQLEFSPLATAADAAANLFRRLVGANKQIDEHKNDARHA